MFKLNKYLCAHFVCLLAALTSITPGCANESAWEEENHSAAEVPPTAPVRAQVVPGNAFDQYSVILKWDALAEGNPYLISRVDQDSNQETFPVSSKAPNTFTDTSVLADREYDYSVHYMLNGTSHQIDAPHIAIPKDLSLSGFHELSSMKVGRLFLEKDSFLVTNGKEVEIEAEQIISDGATIRVFAELEVASDAESKHPLPITLNCRSARGTLVIDARGRPGADGVDGKAGAKGAPGNPGIDGQDSINPALKPLLVENFFENERKFFDRIQSIPHTEPQRASISEEKLFNNIPKYSCTVQPTDGGKGGIGYHGEDAGDGEPGGDSAEVRVNIAQESEFSVSVLNEAGLGGRPGRAGNGGPGGSGGAAGKRDFLRLGQTATDGATGDPGPNGKHGRQGAAGKIQPYSVKKGGKSDPPTSNSK